jgi:uncharacterized protein
MKALVAGAALGVVFGVTLSWSGMASPDVIRRALLFQEAYLFLMFASAVATAAIGLRLLARRERRAALTGEPMTFGRERPERRHVVGSLLFGIGWALADACPGPIAAQLGQGVGWAVFTFAGALGGVWLYQRGGAPDTEPASDALRQRRRQAVVAQLLGR